MFCRKCGKEYEGKFCPNCGEPAAPEVSVETPKTSTVLNGVEINSNSTVSTVKTPFYSQTWFIVLMMFCCCFPVGLFLMWKYKKFNKPVRIIITIFFAICFVVGITSGKTTSTTSESTTAYETSSEENPSEETVPEETTVVDNKEAASAADKEVTDIIASAESDYNKLVTLISSGNASDLSLYDAAKVVKSNLGTYSINVGRVKCDGIKDYTNAATSYIINMQLVASDVMKYIDKQNIKDLSSAKEGISKNESYIFATLSARMEFLKNSGFTDEEIMNILGAAESDDTAK